MRHPVVLVLVLAGAELTVTTRQFDDLGLEPRTRSNYCILKHHAPAHALPRPRARRPEASQRTEALLQQHCRVGKDVAGT